MIYYDNDQWLGVLFTFAGTVWPTISRPLALWSIFALTCYAIVGQSEENTGGGHSILGATMSFLLIFRANQSYVRYWHGRTSVSHFFGHLKAFMMFALGHAQGGKQTVAWLSGRDDELDAAVEDHNDVKARDFRVNMVRLVVAYAVMLKVHTRIALEGYCHGKIDCDTKWLIDWDRLRLRQLLREHEFKVVDNCLGIVTEEGEHEYTLTGLAEQFRDHCDEGPPAHWPESFDVTFVPAARMHSAIVFALHDLLLQNMNDFANTVPWGIKERFVPYLGHFVQSSDFALDMVNQIMSTPVPLPFAHLCKTLLSVWMCSYPFVTDFSLGFFGVFVIPFLVVLALLGIDSISTELENPFGDDANDLDILEGICRLETEAMELLEMTGDFKGRDQFVWRRMPEFVSEQSNKPIMQHLAARELATDEVAPSRSVTPASSHRSALSVASLVRSVSEGSFG